MHYLEWTRFSAIHKKFGSFVHGAILTNRGMSYLKTILLMNITGAASGEGGDGGEGEAPGTYFWFNTHNSCLLVLRFIITKCLLLYISIQLAVRVNYIWRPENILLVYLTVSLSSCRFTGAGGEGGDGGKEEAPGTYWRFDLLLVFTWCAFNHYKVLTFIYLHTTGCTIYACTRPENSELSDDFLILFPFYRCWRWRRRRW